jgi:aryl-alcohol dehydrogenase-like predicted oxidoreductase
MLKIALNWWTEEECRNFVIAVILGVSKIQYLDEDTSFFSSKQILTRLWARLAELGELVK